MIRNHLGVEVVVIDCEELARTRPPDCVEAGAFGAAAGSLPAALSAGLMDLFAAVGRNRHVTSSDQMKLYMVHSGTTTCLVSHQAGLIDHSHVT